MKNTRKETKITVANLTTLLIIITILTSSTLIISSTSGQVEIDWNKINWVLIDKDADEQGGPDWRDVLASYVSSDSSYLYLKLETVNPPKFPTSPDDRDDDKYRWFLDLDGNMYWQGNVLYEAEYLISVQDKNDDGTGEMYLLVDSDNDSNFDDEQRTSIVVNSTDGGFRINGYQLEIYINWSKIGGMPHVLWLSWCTDKSDKNLNQCPTTDRAETAYGVVIRLGSISGYKWEDLNGNGLWDMGNEHPIQGWEIHLQSGAMSWEAYTDESGYYQFIALPEGTYIVSETIPYGWIQTYPGNNSYIVQIRSGEQIAGRDFGNFETMASVSIRKTANAAQAHVGDEIEYSFNITNTGNVPLLIENVTDSVIGSIMINPPLKPSQWIIVNAKYAVKESDPDPLVNTATVYATYNSSTLSASDTWIIDILHPSIMVEKTANATKAYIGDTIQYKINVTNTGDCDLYNVNVSDSLFGNLLTNGILEPKQSKIFTKTYKAESEGQLTNTANASGTDPLGMCVYDENSWTVNVSKPPPATATVTFNATGLSLDASDKTVLTVDRTSYTYSQLPLTFEWIVGSSHNFSWNSPVEVNSGKHYLWTSTSGLSELQNGEIIVPTGGGNITGNYKTQYLVTFSQNGLDSSAFGIVVTVNGEVKEYNDLPLGMWVDGGSTLSYAYEGTVSSTVSGKRFRLDHVSGPSSPIKVTEPVTVTGNYITQYHLMVETDPDGLTPQPTREPAGEQDPAGGWWYNASISVTLIAQQVGGFKFSYWSVNGANQGDGVNPIIVGMDAPKIAIAHYSKLPTVANVTFSVKGVQVDYTGIILIVDEEEYVPDQLPITFTWDIGSNHTFEFKSPLVVNLNQKRYVWISTSGLSVLRNGTITVPNEGGIVEASYKTQYYLNVQSSYGVTGGEGWYDEGATAYATLNIGLIDHGNGTRRVFTHWSGDTSGTNYAQSNPITMNASKTATANWKTQYLLTVVTDPAGLSPQPTRNPSGEAGPGNSRWYDADTNVQLTAQPVFNYTFSYWDVDGLSIGSGVNPIIVQMNETHTATAHYSTIPPPPPPPPTTASVTFSQEGIGLDSDGTVLTVDGLNFTVSQLPVTFTWNVGSSHSFNWADLVGTTTYGKRYAWNSTKGLSTDKSGLVTVPSGGGSVTATYKTQYYLTLATNPDGVTFPFGEGWYDAYSYASILTSEFVSITPEESRYRFEIWTTMDMTEITGPSALSTTVLIDKAKTVTANYVLQYYLTVNSDHGNPTPTSGWFDNGTEISASVTSPYPSEETDTRYVCTGWNGTGSVPESGATNSVTFIINAPSSITWNWKTQYLLIVVTAPSGLTPQPSRSPTGESGPANGWWYDHGTTVTLTANPVSGYTFNYWEVDNTPKETGENPTSLTMDESHTATAHYTTTTTSQPSSPPSPPTTATVTFSQEGIGEDSDGTVLTVDGLNYTVSQLPVTFTWNVGSSHSFNWADPVDTTTYGKRYAWNSTKGLSNLKSGTVTVPFGGGFVNATYKVQYYLEVSSEYGDTSTPSGWYDAGANITVTVTSPVQGPIGTRYVCIGWNGTGSVPSTGNETAISFNLEEPSSITWNWKIQYYLRMDVKPEGAGITTPNSGWYDAGLTVQILARPYSGYRFEGWTGLGLGSYSGIDPQANVTMKSPINETANFVAVATVTFSVKGLAADASGTVLTVDGASYSYNQLPKSFTWDLGSVHTYTWTNTVNAEAGKGYNWTSTSGASTLQSGSLTVSGSGEVTGNYKTIYLLEVLSQYGNPYGGGWYFEGQEAEFGVSTPVDHGNRTIRVFVKWTGDLELYNPEGSIIMNKPCRVSASWETQYLITFNTTLPNGVVLSIPNVPTTLPPGMEVYGAYYPAYETVTVGPAPVTAPGSEGTRYAFKGWDMDGEKRTGDVVLKFTVDGPHHVSVSYGVEHLLIVKALGVESPFAARLTVQTSPPVEYELKPTSPVSLWLTEGVHVTLTVSTPNKIGHGEWAIFKEWTGKAQGTQTKTSLIVLSPTTVNAVFFKVNPVALSIPYSITAGLIALVLCTLIVRRKKAEEHRKRRSAISGITVLAIALIVAAIVSAIIAIGYGINIYELPDITNWAVVFTIIEAIIFLLVSTTITWKVQRKPEEPKTTLKTTQ